MTTYIEELNDVCARKHGGNSNSRAANSNVDKNHWRNMVRDAFTEFGNITCKEVCKILGRQMHQISPRITELKKMGELEPCTYSREGCRVYKLVR